MTTYDDEYVEDAPQTYDGPPIPVHITSDSRTDYTEKLAPDFGSAGTFILQLAGQAQPVQILQRRYRRNKARVLVMNMGAPSTPNSGTAQGAVTTPGAGANISGTIGAAALPAGLYSVTAVTYIDGTPVAGDDDNMKFNQSGGGVQTHIAVPITGQPTTTTILVNFNGAQTISVNSNNAGTAGSIYHASLTVTPVSLTGASMAIFHNRPDVLSLPTPPPNVGIQVFTAPYSFDWESQQPLYGVGIGGLVTVSVIDETYAEPTT